MKKVVVTGMGAVTPLGNTLGKTWEGLKAGVSGIREITRFDPSGLPSRIAGELKGFDPLTFMPPKDILRLDPFVHYTAAAGIMACVDAGLIHAGSDPGKQSLGKRFAAGVVIGSSRGGISSLEKALKGNLLQDKPFSAYLMSSSTLNMAASYLSMRLGIRGPSIGISTACASGTNALGEALNMIRRGDIKIALAGGTDAPVCRLALGGYGASGALSRRNNEPRQASRPFDAERDGFVVSEGAGVLVLEEREHARKRGATPYAELCGYGTTSDARHQTRPDSDGEASAITAALNNAGFKPEAVQYINAHGTSTPLGDRAEAQAIRKVFGKRGGDIPVSATKSMLGHMLGAAGAVEAAVSVLSIREGIIPPTLNLKQQDSEFPLSLVSEATTHEIGTALSHSFGFGGVNAVLVFRKFS